MNKTVSNLDVVTDSERYKSSRRSVSRQKLLKNNQQIGMKHAICQNKTSYIKQIINMQNPLITNPNSITQQKLPTNQQQKQKTYILNSKFINNHNKKNILSSQKLSCNLKQIQHQSFNNKSLTQSQIQNFSLNFIENKLPSSRSSAFVDKHLINKKSQQSNQPILQYKKFDITKLDFSSGFNKPSKQIQSIILPTDNQYSSLVSKSRFNIKKIIQLNRMLKENKNFQNKNQQKSQIQKITQDIQIIEQLSSGCFGKVFKAKIISTGKQVAIKSFPYDRKFHQRQQEICRLISNPFCVKFHKIFHTTDLEFIQSSKNPKPTQNKKECIKDFEEKRNNLSSKKSLRKIQKPIISEKVRFQSQNSDFSTQLQKTFDKKANPLKQHIKEFHNITNIVMDLYDCDLNDYIMMKNKTDNLTLKLFCYQMLRAVLYLHSNHICHRDIKPQNFLVKKHFVVLGDFGSAKIMKNNKNSNVSYICSRYYRAPQLILGYKFYDKSIDIWSLGTTMAELALGKPLFTGANSLDQLTRIIHIIGQPNWRKISFMVEKMPKIPQMQQKGLKQMFSNQISPLFIDLLQNMLKFNPLERITAGQALSHPFFDEIRDQINFQQICKQMDINHFLKFSRDQLKQNQHLKNKIIPLWITQNQKTEGLKTNNFLRL